MPAIGASTTAGSTASAPSFSGGRAVVVGSSVLVTRPRVGGEPGHPRRPRESGLVVARIGVPRRVGDHNSSLAVALPCAGMDATRRTTGDWNTDLVEQLDWHW